MTAIRFAWAAEIRLMATVNRTAVRPIWTIPRTASAVSDFSVTCGAGKKE
jgi:hypothetical protein